MITDQKAILVCRNVFINPVDNEREVLVFMCSHYRNLDHSSSQDSFCWDLLVVISRSRLSYHTRGSMGCNRTVCGPDALTLC